MNQELRKLVEARLDSQPLQDEAGLLVLGALEGGAGLEAALGNRGAASDPARDGDADGPEPMPAPKRGAFLRRVSVEGFRGIGARASLELPPGPGLTLVVGRNGSGKSSFAEGLELLLTGDSRRWEKRSSVWRDGWRNLHHESARLEAELVLEGESGPCTAWREWAGGADLGAASAGAQIHGQPLGPLGDLGWEQPLQTYRPFLSYNELGSLLDEGPSKLYDALSSILGLDDLAAAQKLLGDARKSRDKALKEAKDGAQALARRLQELPDERAARARAQLEAKQWDLAAIDALLSGDADDPKSESEIAVLRRIAGLEIPDAERIASVVAALREAASRVEASRGSLAARSRDLAGLLDDALHFHEAHGDGACPVCGRDGALDPAWHEAKLAEIESLRAAAEAADAAHRAAEQARAAWAALPFQWDRAFGDVGIDAGPARTALEAWTAGAGIEAPGPLADQTEAAAPALLSALAAFRDAGKAELEKRQDLWRPFARELAAWRDRAGAARDGAEAVKALKAAEAWLKEAAAGIRDARFAPIADRAGEVWRFLRQQSHVELGEIRLEGSGPRRKVSLDVTVDGAPGAALGVMSQGELHSLALSLFIPRATLDESPFRFVVIDDPVQSMDPARVDGLAEVLDKAAQDRQVVVFTHDDRLPQAVRRLGIPSHVVEVTRREGSLVEPRPALDPVTSAVRDALALARTEGLPAKIASRVVPGLCRQAVEAACQEAVRRRRLGRGESHASVEAELESAAKLKPLAALALFDDAGRAGEVMTRLNKEGGRDTGDLFKALDRGAHQGADGPLEDLVRGSEKLAGWLRSLK